MRSQSSYAYPAVVDRVAGLVADIGRGSDVKIAEITSLRSGQLARLATATAPAGERELTARRSTDITIAAAAPAMKHAYANAGAMHAVAEAIRDEIAGGLQEAGMALNQVRRHGR